MNASLFKAMLKVHGKNLAGYALGAVIYQWLIIWIYPSVSESSGLNEVIKSMPPSIQKAFGLESGFNNVGSFLAGEFYGLLFLLILIVFSVMTSIQLISKLVDRGSMAYLLATPVSRLKVAFTQMLLLVTGLAVICVSTTLGGLSGIELFIEDPVVDRQAFIELNTLGFLLFSVIAGYSFLISCLMNDEKKALGAAAGLTIIFFAVNMVSKLSEELSWMKNITIFSLYNPQDIMQGEVSVLPLGVSLAVGAAILFVLALFSFKNRDLPL